MDFMAAGIPFTLSALKRKKDIVPYELIDVTSASSVCVRDRVCAFKCPCCEVWCGARLTALI